MQIENEMEQIFYEIFKSVFDENPGFDILKRYNASFDGNDVNLETFSASRSERCPTTSVNVERFVSTTNTRNKLRDNRVSY